MLILFHELLQVLPEEQDPRKNGAEHSAMKKVDGEADLAEPLERLPRQCKTCMGRYDYADKEEGTSNSTVSAIK